MLPSYPQRSMDVTQDRGKCSPRHLSFSSPSMDSTSEASGMSGPSSLSASPSWNAGWVLGKLLANFDFLSLHAWFFNISFMQSITILALAVKHHKPIPSLNPVGRVASPVVVKDAEEAHHSVILGCGWMHKVLHTTIPAHAITCHDRPMSAWPCMHVGVAACHKQVVFTHAIMQCINVVIMTHAMLVRLFFSRAGQVKSNESSKTTLYPSKPVASLTGRRCHHMHLPRP